MNKIVCKALKYIISFIFLILVFNLCLFFTCSFDSKLVENNVRESSETLMKQGTFPIISYFFHITNNNYTDSIIINESYSINNKDPFNSYMKARRNYKKGLTKKELKEANGEVVTVNYNVVRKKEINNHNTVTELYDFMKGKIHKSVNYGRYWHGYLLLYRPLLIIFNIEQIRLLTLIVFSILFLYFIYLVGKRFSISAAIIYGMSLLCSGYFSASYTLESTPIFLTMMISSIIFLKRIDKIKNVGLYIFAVGCITNFVDFLTVPLITLAMLCSLYLLKLIESKKDFKECLKFLIKCSILWVVGYASTWFTKWMLYDLTINDGKSMIKIGISQIFFRVQRVNEVIYKGGNGISTTINMIGKSSVFVILTTVILLVKNKFRLFSQELNKSSLSFLVLAAYPVVWYLVLANHTILHYFFVYRQSFVYMLGMLLFINQLFFAKLESKDENSKKHIKTYNWKNMEKEQINIIN